jgi:ATPase subunit of ABC transporter with duplicated ATPase domains
MSVEKFTDSYNSFSFEKINISMGNKQLIKDGSLSLAPEKRYGIIGKNGAGKTTLMKFINSKIGKNSIYIDQYVTTELQDWYNTNIVEIILTANTERYELIKKYKELESNESSIEDFKEVMDELHALNVDKDESEVKKILRKLGFSNVDLEKNFKEFSGGKKTRINLARALYMKPKVLLLDEPTNHLDLEAIIWLEDYLQNTSSILVVISHNVHFLNAVCTNIIYLNNSSLTTIAGNYNKFNKIRLKDLEKQSKAWDLLKKDINALKSKGKVKEAEALLKKREKEGVSRPTKPYKININFISEKNAKNPYIRIDNLNFEYPNKKIIKNLDFILEEDSRISLIGLNGCGKSTFIKLLFG